MRPRGGDGREDKAGGVRGEGAPPLIPVYSSPHPVQILQLLPTRLCPFHCLCYPNNDQLCPQWRPLVPNSREVGYLYDWSGIRSTDCMVSTHSALLMVCHRQDLTLVNLVLRRTVPSCEWSRGENKRSLKPDKLDEETFNSLSCVLIQYANKYLTHLTPPLFPKRKVDNKSQ